MHWALLFSDNFMCLCKTIIESLNLKEMTLFASVTLHLLMAGSARPSLTRHDSNSDQEKLKTRAFYDLYLTRFRFATEFLNTLIRFDSRT